LKSMPPADGPRSGRSFDNLEAALLARSWPSVSRLLGEALAAGADAWSFIAMALARRVHDHAAAAGGAEARSLPLLTDISAGRGGMGGTSRVVALVPEGPLPLAVGMQLSLPGAPLGQIRSTAGVEAWLRLCRPVALWSCAGASNGSTAAANELLTAGRSNKVEEQVCDALKVASSVHLTEQMLAEVWKALAELEGSQDLFRRAAGTWVKKTGGNGFLL